MPKISVIMPCLNMEQYIEESINSVLRQTLSDIEILVIDAGSTDKTLKIVERYMKADKRIRLLISDKKSYGYQVNMGISAAVGNYIAIVDTDDRIMPDAYESLYSFTLETEADYVKGTANLFYTVSNCYTYRIHLSQFNKSNYTDGKIEVIPRKMPELLEKDCFLWYGIYKNDFLKKIRLNESPGAAYQDASGLLQIFLKAEKAIYIDKTIYEYRQDNFNASEYNRKAFTFIYNEYNWGKQFVEKKSLRWKRVFYHKLYCHMMTRFPVMVVSGYFWSNDLLAMKNIASSFQHAFQKGIIEKADFKPTDWDRIQIFMKDPEELYEKMEDEYQESTKRMITLLNIMETSPVVIFGCGNYGNFLGAVALNNHINTIQGFCDSSAYYEGKTMYGKKIFTPERAVELYPTAIYVIASKSYGNEMKSKLKELGILEKNIYMYLYKPDMKLLRIKLL